MGIEISLVPRTPPRRCWHHIALYCKPLAGLFYQNFGIVVLVHLTRFFSASFVSRSVFGEDALVNVSVEKKDDNDGKLAGYIRIRSKTQGIALSLGDRITSVQRGLPPNQNE
jgi:hypothetical protein